MRIYIKNLLIWSAGAMGVVVLERLDAPLRLIFVSAVVFLLVGVYLDWFFRTRRHRIFLAILAIVYFCVAGLAWKFTPSGFRIYYENAPLNGQNVPLARNIDPKRIQSQFYIWPGSPFTFNLVRIAAKNVGNVVEEPEVVYLSFSTPVTPVPDNDGWILSSGHNFNGCTITYQSRPCNTHSIV